MLCQWTKFSSQREVYRGAIANDRLQQYNTPTTYLVARLSLYTSYPGYRCNHCRYKRAIRPCSNILYMSGDSGCRSAITHPAWWVRRPISPRFDSRFESRDWSGIVLMNDLYGYHLSVERKRFPALTFVGLGWSVMGSSWAMFSTLLLVD